MLVQKLAGDVRHISYQQWAGADDFEAGRYDDARISGGRLVMGSPVSTRRYQDPHSAGAVATYDVASWTSPLVTPAFPFTELVASWNSVTPPGTWVEISATVSADDGGPVRCYCLGRWSMDRATLSRTSVADQGDDLADVRVDVLAAREGRRFTAWQLTVALNRLAGSVLTPEVSLVGAMASAVPEELPVEDGAVPEPRGVALEVPTYSQQLHADRHPEYSGGGRSWCSPTSTAMVLRYFAAGPTPEDYACDGGDECDPQVVHAVAHSYDWAYGPGNWPFNTAYASELGMRAFVTRLRSLSEAAEFVAAGIPLVASVSFTESELTGAGYSTAGHLLVIVGFTPSGDVVVNDPASHGIADDAQVRVVYDRRQFTTAWLRGSGGIVYVIHPPAMALPPRHREANW